MIDGNYANLCVVADPGHRKLSGTVHIFRRCLVFFESTSISFAPNVDFTAA